MIKTYFQICFQMTFLLSLALFSVVAANPLEQVKGRTVINQSTPQLYRYVLIENPY